MIGRYIFKRLLHMFPTMFGVILITFILFNLVGGSPGLMMLGDKASPSELEAFDEQRGFNRPWFWGRYTQTRLYPETEFTHGVGSWTSMEQVSHHRELGGFIRIVGPSLAAFPLAFDYQPGVEYEWRMKYRAMGNPSVVASEETITLNEGADQVVRWRDTASVAVSFRPAFHLPDGAVLDVFSLQCVRVNARPWQSQWTYYIGQLLRFDFGISHASNQPVLDLLRQGIGPTLMLATPILVGETVVSLILALGCAYFRNRWFDRLALVGCVMLMSINYLVWIVAGQYWLGFRWNLFPVWGFESFLYLGLPIVIGILHGLGPNVRFYRAVMLEEMHRDYVRTALAKGVGPGGILFRHVLKNTMIPVITNVVLSLPFLYTGSLLLESFFGIPGLGYVSINAINSSDVDVVRAVVLIGSFLYLAANLLADILYAWVDPRVKLS
ncbi:MAG TPA: ABC transporter permease [Kiritimatiellia bacterium]|nr:ABC transporter permease [Kiritimatiellia bacterium]